MDIKKVAIFGGGTIGGGFAAYYALKGLKVEVFEAVDASVEYAKGVISNVCKSYVELGMLENAEDAKKLITISTDPKEVFEGASFIQENGKEDIEEKRKIIAQIEQYAPEDTVIASSSSSIPPSVLAEGAKHPERIIVAHPFNPSYLLPLVEIAGGEKTEQKYIDIAVEFYKDVDKVPVVMKKEKVGFIANRLAHAVWREELAMVMEGVCTLEDADNALTFGPGLRWAALGPALNYELGAGDAGIHGMLEKFAGTAEMVFSDLSDMSKLPDGAGEACEEGMKTLIADLPDNIGKSHEEIAAFRDAMIVSLLKQHQKF